MTMAEQPKPKVKRRPGRPTELDRVLPSGQTVEERILELVRSGATYVASAQSVGVAEDTFKNWRNPDRYPGERYSTFRTALKAAEGEQRMACELGIARAGRGIPIRTTKTTRRPVRDGNRVVRDENGEIIYEESTEVTDTFKVYWQANAWWLERRKESREEFPRPLFTQPVPAGGPVPALDEVPEHANAALDEAWEHYMRLAIEAGESMESVPAPTEG